MLLPLVGEGRVFFPPPIFIIECIIGEQAVEALLHMQLRLRGKGGDERLALFRGNILQKFRAELQYIGGAARAGSHRVLQSAVARE